MPINKEQDTDENDDRVRIRLGNDDLLIVEEYGFQCSILQQPAAFTLRLSAGQGAQKIIAKYPPGPMSRCALYIGPYRQFTGEVDAVNAFGDSNATSVEIRGRDLMARLHDTDIPGERSFNNASYEELFKAALKDVGQGDKIVEVSNAANRKVRSGYGVKVQKEPVLVSEVKQVQTSTGFRNVVTAKLGETWLHFLERHFAKLGLFPWCDANGNYVLSRPNGDQEAAFHFFRKRGQAASVANVKSFRFTNDTTTRRSEIVIFARNGGRKQGHNHVNGGFVDEEMRALKFIDADKNITIRRRVERDVNVTTEAEAKFYARRKIAEANRAGWKLQYTIAGHTAPTLADPKKRAVVIPDMVARVDDDELGIHENLYIESVEYRSPPRTTVVTMMRPQDLLFGDEQATAGIAQAKASTKKKVAASERLRSPIDFKRDDPNAATNAVLDPSSKAFGVSMPKIQA